MNFALISICF